MKIGIFGCGNIYKKYKSQIPSDHEIIAFLDNDITGHKVQFEGKDRVYPREISNYKLDCIVLMSESASKMKTQLIRLGFPEHKIIHYKDYFGSLDCKKNKYPAKIKLDYKKQILIISNELGYHGGPITVLRTAKCAIKLGYKVTVAASKGDKNFINELNDSGCDVVIQDWIEHASEENLNWVSEFEIVVINTIPEVKCACRISKYRNVILWLHDSPDPYENMEYWHDEVQSGLLNENIKIYVVSDRAKENFLRFYKYRGSIEILPVAIEDWKTEKLIETDKTTIAVIGPMMMSKGQDSMLNAVQKISVREKCNFIFIGKSCMDEYWKKIGEQLIRGGDIIYLGEKNTDEMKILYQFIDIVVVPSRDETFSMVAAEAMMMGKTCIVTDNCGISVYIENGINGFIYKTGDAEMLAEKINWCVLNKKACNRIGIEARKTYEKYFTMTILEKNLEKIFEKSVWR